MSAAWKNATDAMPGGPFMQDLAGAVSNDGRVESAQLWLLHFASDHFGTRKSPWPAFDLFVHDFEALERIWPAIQGACVMVAGVASKETLPNLARFMVDRLPQHWDRPLTETCTAPVTVAVRLADRIEHLVSLFAAQVTLTGSKDPYALRRAAKEILAHILPPIGRAQP